VASIIALANNKGGTGKTTTALNLAAGLARENCRVLLIDADDQSGTATDWRNVRADHAPGFELLAMRAPTLHVELPALLERADYTHVLVDCPPGGPNAGGKMTRSALWVAHLVLIPVAPSGPDFWASDPMVQMLDELAISRPGRVISRLLINRKSVNTRLGREARTAAAELLPLPVLNTEITQRASIAEAITRGMTIFDFDPGGLAALEYQELTEEVLQCLK
jgi:chromosome partitioning protein